LSGVVRFLICHYHWIDYQRVPIAVERRHMRRLHTTKTAGLSHAREHAELYYGVA
jgi:hypothetical protein